MTSTTADILQPYAAAYMAAHPDRVFAGHEYIVWISGQWQAWAAESGAPYGDRPMTDEQRAAFGAWLADRWALDVHGAECPLSVQPGVSGAVGPSCECVACYCGDAYERGWMGSCARCYRPVVRYGRVVR